MRISETKVVQLVESDPPVLVLIDEAAPEPEVLGRTETVLSSQEVLGLAHAIMYFRPFLTPKAPE